MYSIVLARSAIKDMNAIAEPFQSAIKRKIEALRITPLPHGAKKMTGYKHVWRVRVGDYRIVYTVDEHTKTVDISGIGHRREIYKP